MNIAHTIRQALLEANVVRQNGTTSALFAQAELLNWAQFAVWQVEKVIRGTREDHYLRILGAVDSAFTWDGITYTPSTALLTANTLAGKSITLPPDFLTMKHIQAEDDPDRQRYTFRKIDMGSTEFQRVDTISSPAGGTEILYDVISDDVNSYLRMANPPDAVQLQIAYIVKSRRMRLYSTGTIALTLDSADVVGTSTVWVGQRLYAPMELILNSTLADPAPVIVSQTSTADFVDPSIPARPVLANPTSNTALTLAATYPLASETSTGYLLAQAPAILRNHADVVVRYLIHKILSRVRSPLAAQEYQLYKAEQKEMKEDMQVRSLDPEFVEDWLG